MVDAKYCIFFFILLFLASKVKANVKLLITTRLEKENEFISERERTKV